ncbi:hypothetical protein R3W88_022992 [Solanum pinnatisectum]|uniref:Uncharacterized protein n=1 Tax=Solanum pinnatisectum TaxID=50273 RepID=A0AAV9LYC7_9SOLN|nr:hypothetical protein R3W88_022992 [Solanum pinnatisectum]
MYPLVKQDKLIFPLSLLLGCATSQFKFGTGRRGNNLELWGVSSEWEFSLSRKLPLRTLSFNDKGAKNVRKSDISEESLKHKKQKLIPITSLVIDKEKNGSRTKKSITELDAAATKIQTVYKSHRTRRNLADCALLVEHHWRNALDSAALKQSSISFFDVNKHEVAESRWSCARTMAAKVDKGLKDEEAQKLALQQWLEAIDPRRRYGHNLHFYDAWFNSKSSQPFFYWLDVGDGKRLNLESYKRADLQCRCFKYLFGPKEREANE